MPGLDFGRRPAVPRLLLAAAALAAGAGLIVWQASVRRVEAAVSARLVSLIGLLPAHRLGTAVVFILRGRFVGYNLTPECTAAFLIAPFFFIGAAAIVAAPRVPILRTVTTVALITALLFVVNQVRLAVIAGSMRAWGFVPGYDISHVLLGTMVSTLGIVGGLLLFLARVGFWQPARSEP